MKIHKCLDFIVVKAKSRLRFVYVFKHDQPIYIKMNLLPMTANPQASEKTLKIKCKKSFRMFRQNYLKYESVQLHPAVIKFTPFCLLLLMQQKMRVHSILRTWYKKVYVRLISKYISTVQTYLLNFTLTKGNITHQFQIVSMYP